jgi:NTP pyrophosphatase (non-canonical NTP hydrolase)
MPDLALEPKLNDFQDYVRDMKIERGFSTDDKVYECFLLGEEMGELFKAVRKQSGWKIDDRSQSYDVAEELADCFIYLLSIANQHDVDLEQAFRDKEEKNKTRQWKKVV